MGSIAHTGLAFRLEKHNIIMKHDSSNLRYLEAATFYPQINDEIQESSIEGQCKKFQNLPIRMAKQSEAEALQKVTFAGCFGDAKDTEFWSSQKVSGLMLRASKEVLDSLSTE